MKINVDLRVSKPMRKSVRKAVEASARVAPLSGIYSVEVKAIKKKQRKYMEGDAALEKGQAIIRVDFSKPKNQVLDTVYHEAYHLHQMAVGKLKQAYFGLWWRGIFIPVWLYERLHSMMPFEREAIAHAKKMLETSKNA